MDFYSSNFNITHYLPIFPPPNAFPLQPRQINQRDLHGSRGKPPCHRHALQGERRRVLRPVGGARGSAAETRVWDAVEGGLACCLFGKQGLVKLLMKHCSSIVYKVMCLSKITEVILLWKLSSLLNQLC